MARTLDEILAVEKPEVVAKAREKASEMLLNIHLAELRERVQKTQEEVALTLGRTSPWDCAGIRLNRLILLD